MNLCFIGYGSIAKAHARAFRQLGGTRFHTVVGRRLEATEEFAREFGFERVTLDWDEALANSGIDAVVITSPSDLHAAQTEAALRAGKHVLAEIPLATNYADAERVTQLAKGVRRTLMVAHTQRFYPALQEARWRIASSALRVHHVVCRWFFFRRENVNWEGKQRSWTDNLLWHHACHVVDSALWLLGAEVKSVHGTLGPPHPVLQTPLDLNVSITTQQNQLISIAMSYNSHLTPHEYVLVGEEDTLMFENGRLYSRDGVVFEPENPQPITEQNREFLAAVREGRAPSVSGDAVLPAMRVLQLVEDINR
jgi:2-hydroxy-4-carboxymuconate semialdehyde hemiacetal dehydrogenase